MCGRFTLTIDPAELRDEFQGAAFPSQFAPRFNIAPTQPILAIPNDGRNAADFFLWGLIPSWAKDPSIGNRLINARGETLREKPAFRGAYKYKRCLILADGFYEWKSQAGTKSKIPHYVHLKTRKPFAFAGLWDEWLAPEGSPIRSCAIVTTTPNQLMAAIHNRMPVILTPEDRALWIDSAPRTPDSLSHLLRPFADELMEAYPVSTLVNNPANDSADCLHPSEPTRHT
jgi:putative SOS response-associated peptidase YedK